MTDTPTLRLITCVGVDSDRPLLEHFLTHYARLGIEPAHMHAILNGPAAHAPEMTEARTILRRVGCPEPVVWTEPYTSDAMWEMRRAVQADVAGPQDWIVNADVDEFHEYPAPLADFLDFCAARGVEAVQGPFVDRLAPGGTLATVDPASNLFAQFPIAAEVQGPLGGQSADHDLHGTVKLMLHRAHVRPSRGGHHPMPGEAPVWLYGRPLAQFGAIGQRSFRAAIPTRVHHFKWTAGLRAGLERRLATPGVSPAGRAYGRRLLDYLDGSDKIDLADVQLHRRTPALPWRARLVALRARHGLGWRRHALRQRLRRAPPPPAPPRPLPPDAGRSHALDGWVLRKLTLGTEAGIFHSHSYYDIPVFDRDGSRIAAHRMDFQERAITAQDRVTVGVVDTANGGFTPLGESRAFSWQQGPMAQFVPGTRRLVWSDRDTGGAPVARLHDLETGHRKTLPRPVYALSPDGRTALSLNMDRLETLRPGYGHAGSADAAAEPRPADDGVWRMDLSGGAPRLILSLEAAVRFLRGRLGLRSRLAHARGGLVYWFNHAKIAPDGRRFTVKLRWRKPQGRWNEAMGVSLTVGMDGGNPALLAPATSHVIWLDDRRLYFWQRGRLRLFEDARPVGRHLSDLLPELVSDNVHVRHLPSQPGVVVFDTPYREEIDLVLADRRGAGAHRRLARFTGHKPARGQFRCDLHPVPSPDGRRIVLTTLADGGRQMWLAERPVAPR